MFSPKLRAASPWLDQEVSKPVDLYFQNLLPPPRGFSEISKLVDADDLWRSLPSSPSPDRGPPNLQQVRQFSLVAPLLVALPQVAPCRPTFFGMEEILLASPEDDACR